jgi:hypothetical protein
MPAEERDERELRQVDLMDLKEELLSQAWVRCRLLLFIESIQGWVAVEGKVASTKVIGGRWDLVTREQTRIVGVVAKAGLKFSNIISARHRSRGRRSLPLSQEGAEEGEGPIVLDIEFDADLLHIALNDRLVGKT